MKKNILYAAILFFCQFSFNSLFGQMQNAKPAKVFITAGQSNTDGRVKNSLLPNYIKSLTHDTAFTSGAYPHVKIAQNRTDGRFAPYWPKGRITPGLWTYDAVTYYLLDSALQEDLYVVKWAVGGTSIGYDVDGSKGRYWSADPQWLKKTASVEQGGSSLLLSFTNAIDAAIDQTLSKLEQGYQIEAFLWHQGESDYQRGASYYNNLRGVIKHVRHHLTQKTGHDYSKLPFVFGSIPKSNKNFDELVDAGMQRIAEEDLNVFMIDLSNQDLQRDRLHFTQETAEYFGKQMFKVLDRILGLSDHNFRVARYKGDKLCAISYTFDDGLKEHYTLVAPRFRELGFKGTFWINGSKVNPREDANHDTSRVTWEQLREMAMEGHEISNHGWAHRNFGRHTLIEIKEDVVRNDSVLLAEIGVMPRTFCYPNNKKTPEGFAFVNKNRIGTRLLQHAIGSRSDAQNLEEWVEALLADRAWGVGMIHGITYGYDHFASPAVFWQHLDQIKSQEDSIWVGTFQEVAAYQKEQKRFTYDLVKNEDGFVIKPHLTLDKTLFTEPLTAVIDRANLRSVTIHQGKKRIQPRVLPDKVLFDFDPFGEDIKIIFK